MVEKIKELEKDSIPNLSIDPETGLRTDPETGFSYAPNFPGNRITIPDEGIKIWGQKTFLAPKCNVKSMLLYVEKAISDYLNYFIWEIPDETTISIVDSGANSFLREAKERKGIEDYRTETKLINITWKELYPDIIKRMWVIFFYNFVHRAKPLFAITKWVQIFSKNKNG